jgi:signal peptide peptidase SppA
MKTTKRKPMGMIMPTPNKIKKCAAQHFGVWAIEPKWFQDAMRSVKAGTWKADFFDDDDDEDVGPGYERVGNIAIIRIQGQMTKGRSSFGGCCTTDVRKAVRDAAGDYLVKGIMLVVDSPGGTVAGTQQLAEDVANASDEKPVHGYANDMACSAAYWVISQCDRVAANATAIVGNIGTYTCLIDDTGAQDIAGTKWEVISTGKYKGLGADGKVTDDLRSDVQREVNELNAEFLKGVMAGRGKDQEWMDAMSDGRAHVGGQAKQLGLIDDVASFDAAMEALQMEVLKMTNPTEAFKAAHPDAYKALVDGAKAEGVAEGRKAGETEGYEKGANDAMGRHAALAKAFPDRPGFVAEQFAAGHDVGMAKANLADVLLKENADLKKAAAESGNRKPDDPEQTGVPFEQGGNQDDVSQARIDELLAKTPDGRAILAERKKNQGK